MILFKYVFQYIKKYPHILIFLLLSSILSTVIGIILPYISGGFIDDIIEIHKIEIVYKYAFIYTLATILQIVFQYITMLSQTKLSAYTSTQINLDVLKHLQNIPLDNFNDKDIAYLNQRIYSDSSSVTGFILDTLIQICTKSLSLIITLFIILKVNKILFVFFIICTIIYFIQFKIIRNPLYKYTTNLKEQQSRFFSSLYDLLDKVKLIKLYNCSEYFIHQITLAFNVLYKTIKCSQKTNFLFQIGQISVSSISKVILMVVGGIQLLKGNLTVGMFSILLSYLGMILNDIVYFVNIGQGYVGGKVSYDRIMDILNIEAEKYGEKTCANINEIFLNNLGFKFGEKVIFSDLSYSFRKGEIYCINGINGSGKTTLLEILAGLKLNYQGNVILNKNISLRTINLRIFRSNNFAIALQEPLFFNDMSIKDNILFNNQNIDINMLNYYISGFGLFDNDKNRDLSYIINPKYDNLSGGELQKISLIRTMLSLKDVLCFDEPSTYLDNESTIFFLQELEKLKDDHIIIIVSHDKDIINYCNYKLTLGKEFD